MYKYRNPFSEYNSNIMSSEQIAEFFAEPFDFFDITATDIQHEKMPIVFVGGRGTGKTMLLRQFSYHVQKLTLPEDASFIEKVRTDKFIGIYFRVDTPLLRSLESIGSLSNDPFFAEGVFTHFFELTIFKEYLEIIRLFLTDCNFGKSSSQYKMIIKEIIELINHPSIAKYANINEIISFVEEEINYVWRYQSKKSIDIKGEVCFSPACGLIMHGNLSNKILETSIFDVFDLKDINVLLLIDEFENFSAAQQKVINTAMRFSKEKAARYRIGMRPGGFKEFGTLDDADFVKEGRDYRKVECGFALIKKGQQPYPKLIMKIADKRLNASPEFTGKSIKDILGDAEDLESEAKEIVGGGTKHILRYIELINNKLGTKYSLEDFSSLRDENPLYEMECLRLLLSGRSLEYVQRAFSDYKNKISSPEQKKFKNDYQKKYKFTFVLVLCSIYRVEKKKYYSFKGFCQLSSGVAGLFIELCRTAFDIAYFREKDKLFEGHISQEVQTDAAYEVAYSERAMIPRIKTYGTDLEIFIDNLGNVFSIINKDLHMRYPETNSFPIKAGTIKKENQALIEKACMWSLIVKKPTAQDTNASGKKQDVFYLNRIFAPIYKISYRIRGGFNPVVVDDLFFEAGFKFDNILRQVTSKGNDLNEGKKQMHLFQNTLSSDNTTI